MHLPFGSLPYPVPDSFGDMIFQSTLQDVLDDEGSHKQLLGPSCDMPPV